MGAIVQLNPDTVATVSIERVQAKTPFESSDKPRFQRLVPYVKGALQLRLRQRGHTQHAGTYAASLDALAFGVVICNARAEIRFANTPRNLWPKPAPASSFPPAARRWLP